MGTEGSIQTQSRPWSSCKPAPAFAQESRRGPSGEAPEGRGLRERPRFLVDETEGILFALGQAVEQRDNHTAGHCERLAFMSVAMGMAMRLDRAALLSLYQGGYLHDVGKVGMPDSILFKPGALSPEEWVTMRSHPARGEEICRHVPSLRHVLPLIRHHHERWNGSGYPDGLRGEQIPLGARLLQVADIYDALISPRPYKDPYSPEQALQILREEADRGWRDPQVVDILFRLHEGVISKIADLTTGADHDLQAMRAALDNLQDFLESARASGIC